MIEDGFRELTIETRVSGTISTVVTTPPPTTHKILEEYETSAGSKRATLKVSSEEGDEICKKVQEKFGVHPRADLGSPAVALMTPENIVTCKAKEAYQLGTDGEITTDMKFFLDTGEACLKTVKAVTGEKPELFPFPHSIVAIGLYEDYAKYSRPDWTRKTLDCYMNADHEAFCEHYGITAKQGKYRTYYGVKVTGDKQVGKVYRYDESSPQSQWDELVRLHLMAMAQQQK